MNVALNEQCGSSNVPELPHLSLISLMTKLRAYIVPMLFLLMMSAGLPSLLFSQAMWRMPITLIDSGAATTPATYFGVHPAVTNCSVTANDTVCGFTDHWSDSAAFFVPYTPCTFPSEFESPPAPPG